MTRSTQHKKINLSRLKNRREFLHVANHGQKCATPGLVLQACNRNVSDSERYDTKTNLEQRARIGYTVSRKVGNAVNRNRAKRRLRAVASKVLTIHGCKNTDFVLIGRTTTLVRPFGCLIKDLKAALRNLDCFKE